MKIVLAWTQGGERLAATRDEWGRVRGAHATGKKKEHSYPDCGISRAFFLNKLLLKSIVKFH
jgi:hypothetical protein